MGNQGKVAKKQRQNYVYVFLHNSILSFLFERKLTVYGETLFLHLLVFLSRLSQTLVYLSEKRKCYFVARTAKTLSNHSVLIIKKKIPSSMPTTIARSAQNTGKPGKGVSLSTRCGSSPNVKSEWKYKDKQLL